nr:hypothetical protein [Lachnospiraceae bacterium]
MKNQADWLKDPRVNDIDPAKLQFLQKLVFEMQKLSDKEKLPFLMALASGSRKKNISFSEAEVSTIIEVLRDYSSAEDLSKMNRVLSMFKPG